MFDALFCHFHLYYMVLVIFAINGLSKKTKINHQADEQSECYQTAEKETRIVEKIDSIMMHLIFLKYYNVMML